MEEFAVGSRQPIENLHLQETAEILKIIEKFDMFREVFSGMMRDALSFGYLEHLMRVSTPQSEVSDAIRLFPRSLQTKMSELVALKEEVLQEALHILDTRVTRDDLKLVKVNLLNINHKWDGKKLAIEENDEGNSTLLPVCYTLSWKNKYFILYTPNMSYVDGYDSFTGNVNIPIIPEAMLQIMTNGFYQKVTSKGVQVELLKKVKKPKIENLEQNSKPNVVENSASYTFEEPKTLSFAEKIKNSDLKKIDSGDYSENIEIPSRDSDNVHENEVEEEDEEYEEEEKEREEENVKKPVIARRPVEKTWERYEKKATYYKKERDQCGPGDCTTF